MLVSASYVIESSDIHRASPDLIMSEHFRINEELGQGFVEKFTEIINAKAMSSGTLFETKYPFEKFMDDAVKTLKDVDKIEEEDAIERIEWISESMKTVYDLIKMLLENPGRKFYIVNTDDAYEIESEVV